ncbi:MAG: MBL fold metallo-hydrolase [Armatimonadetes bacterium]|nr:MBL fold metallo-hydrolase [Armatimonadota bacterium]
MIAENIAPEVYRLNVVGLVNAYLVGNAQGWVLVDAGIAGQFEAIKDAADQVFGFDARPQAIILTHAHTDHAGSALPLAVYWNVPVFAHPLELPFITGKSDYPPADPTTGGLMGFVMRFAPGTFRGRDFGDVARELPDGNMVPGLGAEWRFLETPGHTPGHVSLWRERDAVLIAGDAVITMDLDSPLGIFGKPAVSQPPIPVTTDWHAERKTIETLAALKPKLIATGHGEPVSAAVATAQLIRLAETFRFPETGRYVPEPAEFDLQGVRYLPPAPSDPLPAMVGVMLACVAVGFGVWTIRNKRA